MVVVFPKKLHLTVKAHFSSITLASTDDSWDILNNETLGGLLAFYFIPKWSRQEQRGDEENSGFESYTCLMNHLFDLPISTIALVVLPSRISVE